MSTGHRSIYDGSHSETKTDGRAGLPRTIHAVRVRSRGSIRSRIELFLVFISRGSRTISRGISQRAIYPPPPPLAAGYG